MATEALQSSGNKLGIKVRKHTRLIFFKLWANPRRKTEFNQKRFYWWISLSFRLNFGPCMLTKPSHFSEIAFCIISGERPWTGIHLGERDLRIIRQKLAKSAPVPCWVWRHLPLCRLADFSFLGCHLNVFGCLGENSRVAGSGCLSKLMLAEPSAIALCYFTSMFSAHVAFLLPKYEDEPSGASSFYEC